MSDDGKRVHRDAGTASAENGVVLLDGPDGVAITMTAAAALRTGHSLIGAAILAEGQEVSQSAANGYFDENNG